MIIKRIKKIQQVGSYYDCTDIATYDWCKTTIFYGQNTYGKTTLTDIFKSLSLNDKSFVTDRLSIPNQGEQIIELSVSDGGSEKCVNYKNGWQSNILQNKISIFDNDFIHKNLISGIEVTRENKESFTDFVLGEEGVTLSEEIATKKKDLGERKSNLKNLRPLCVKEKSEDIVDRFISYHFSEDREKLNEEAKNNNDSLDLIERREEIVALPRIIQIDIVKILQILTIHDSINLIMNLGFKDFTETAIDSLNEHIQKHTSNSSETESWIKTGFNSQIVESHDSCPFCGQSILEVKNLFSTYESYFSDEYERFVKEDIVQPLNTLLGEISNISIDSVLRSISIAENSISKYGGYSMEIGQIVDFKLLESDLNKIRDYIDSYKGIADKKAKEKKTTPHKIIPEIIMPQDLKDCVERIKNEALSINKILTEKDSKAQKFKMKYTQIDEKKAATEKEILNKKMRTLKYKIARLEYSEECNTYKKEKNEIEALEIEIKDLTDILESQQSDYLKNYFTDLNSYFKMFGADKFELSCENNSRGYKKVYYLNVKYQNKTISNEKLNKVFSESDKRSLALSIFLAKIKQIDNKSVYILIFDDPAVSFDDNRSRKTADIISCLAEEYSQIIILSHYLEFIKKLYDLNSDARYLELKKNSKTATYTMFDPREKTLSDMDRAFEKIWNYINRVNEDDIAPDCRIFFEKYLELRYKKDIYEKNIRARNLAELILKLKENSVIDAPIFNELDAYRKSLNGDHHQFSFGDNTEEIITYAKDMLNYIYKL